MKLTPYILIALSFIGLADTMYLSYFAYMNTVPGCAIGGCEQVLSSSLSKLMGIPYAYIGLVYYVYLLALSILMTLEENSRALALGALVYTGIGVMCSAFFEFYIQGTLIGAYCMYCAISALTTLALAITAGWHWRNRSI